MNCFLEIYFILFLLSVISAQLVSELKAENFIKVTTRTDGHTLIMFYTPWCPHCQETKPHFIKAASKIKELNVTFALLNCDVEENTNLCNSQKIDGYPTIKLYSSDGKIHNFMAEVTEDNLLKFCNNPNEMTDSVPQEEETSDIALKYTPYLNNENYTNVLKKTEHALVFFYAPWCPHCQDVKPKIDAAAVKLNSQSHKIFSVNCEEKNSKKLCDDEKIDGFPTIRYFHAGELYGEYDDNMQTNNFLKFLSKPPKEKQPLPSQSQDSTNEELDKETKMKNVDDITKDDFDSILKTHKNHFMTMFYVPNCSHCKDTKPIFDAAAEEIHKSVSGIIFLAVNCESRINEPLCQKEKIDGFPTLIHYNKGVRVKEYNDIPITKEKLVLYFSSKLKDEL